jgi:hypothetical protein
MNEIFEKQLRKLNALTHLRQTQPDNLLYQFREYQAEEELKAHFNPYGAVGYPLPEAE